MNPFEKIWEWWIDFNINKVAENSKNITRIKEVCKNEEFWNWVKNIFDKYLKNNETQTA